MELATPHVAMAHDAREAPRIVRARQYIGGIGVVGHRVAVGEIHVGTLGKTGKQRIGRTGGRHVHLVPATCGTFRRLDFKRVHEPRIIPRPSTQGPPACSEALPSATAPSSAGTPSLPRSKTVEDPGRRRAAEFRR